MKTLTLLSVFFAAGMLAGNVLAEPKTPPAAQSDPIAAAEASLKAAKAKDRALWQYRLGAMYLRSGRPDDAKRHFDEALARVNGIVGRDESASASRNKFKAESTKTFIGEPYERVMANFYRGILYWQDGELDNARACFINAQFQDSDAGQAYLLAKTKKKKAGAEAEMDAATKYSSDYVLCGLLDGWTMSALGGDGSEAFHRAAELANNRLLPAYTAEPRVLVFAEYGAGPTKYADGEHKSQLRFKLGTTNVVTARLKVNGSVCELPPLDDLNFQATTRGGRVMDYVLEGKAKFKSGTDTAGNVGLMVGAAAVSTLSYTGDMGGYAAAGAMVFGLGAKLVSAMANASADVRCWDNLPAYLSFGTLQLYAGRHQGTVEFLDVAGEVVTTREINIHVPEASASTVVFVSDRMP
jgi:tetratricopeptide (TPR) repeat protein